MTKSQTLPEFKEVEAIGITRFQGPSNWNRNFGELTHQGGKATNAGPIKFTSPFKKQLLYLSLAGGTTSGESLNGFTASGPGYWFAIGV